MLRFLKWPLILTVLMGGFILLPASFYSARPSYDETPDYSTITDYHARFRITSDGDLLATERLTVNFPVERHGIFRFFDIVDPSAPHARRIPEGISVMRDGHPDQVDVSSRSDGRYRVVRVGAPDVTMRDDHDYTITYRIPGVLEPGTTGMRSQLYWNVIPGGWTMPIERAVVTVDLPAASQRDVRCAVGVARTSGCEVEGGGTRRLSVTTGHLDPRTPVTIKTGVDVSTPSAGHRLPWTPQWDAVLGRHLPATLVTALLAVAAGGFGWRKRRLTMETDPAFPVMYAPPTGIGPAQAGYLLTERTHRNHFIGTILYAAERGAVELTTGNDGTEESWTIRGGKKSVWAELDDVTRELAGDLGIRDGGNLTLGKKHVSAGHKAQEAESGLGDRCKKWGLKAGHLESIRGLTSIGVGGIIALVSVPLLAFLAPFSLIAAVPLAFGAPAATVLGAGKATRRTAAGRRLWSEIGGFKRILSTDSSEDRFDFSARKDLYPAYIPWAVAFGVADEWAKKYRTEVGEEPPIPSYFPTGTSSSDFGGSTSEAVSHMTDGFSAAVSAAIGAYAATQVSTSSSSSSSSSWSSSSGGGFSGGGGGGGGGGGSW